MDESSDKPFRCRIQSQVFFGELTPVVAKRAGFDDPDRGAGYFPCKEFQDTRGVGLRRGRRVASSQEMLSIKEDSQ